MVSTSNSSSSRAFIRAVEASTGLPFADAMALGQQMRDRGFSTPVIGEDVLVESRRRVLDAKRALVRGEKV